jgi:pyruvate/2-oxoglutarate dehydrogenase complex dihydrolipoamide acyltransferase (E2) component
MSNLIELKVPDIGGHSNVDVIEVFVKPGDVVSKDDSLITLETDKATMEVPAETAGVVKEVKVAVGQGERRRCDRHRRSRCRRWRRPG